MITYLQLANLVPVLWFYGKQGWLMLLPWRQPLIVRPFFPSRCFPWGSCPKCSPSFLPMAPGYWSQIPLSLRLAVYARMLWSLGCSMGSLTCLLATQMTRAIVETDHSFLNYVIKSKSVFCSVLISKGKVIVQLSF